MSFTVATFQFNNDKNCFATLPNECFNRIPKHTEIAVFEVTPNDGPCIYVSCKNKQSVSRGDKIILNGLFGSKLGLKDGEQVIIRHLTSVPSCSQLSVEPVSVDDWEILERHAAFVESNVMDQVRVVWKGQVFPVWVEKSICLFLKIGVTEPGANCVILNNETEVIVLPKLRTETKSQKTSHFNPPAKKPDYFPANELDDYKMQNFDPPDDELDNSRGRNKKWSGDKISPSKWNLKDWLPWLLGGQQSNENESGKFIPDTGQGLVKSDRRLSIDNTQDSLENGLNFTFRIQSLMVNFDTKDNKHSDIDGDDEDVYSSLQDATSVFVNREDVLAQLGNKNAYVPEIFLAKLKKLPSPKDQLVEIEKQLSNQKKDTSKSTDKKSTEKLSEKKSESSKDKMIEAVVKVIVIDKKRVTADEHRQELLSCLLSEQQCHRGHVIISGLLRRLLKLDVTSRIWLQVTDAVPANPSKYEIHPVGSVPISITSQLIQMALRNWVKRVTTKKMPLIVFHGVAVKFPIITDTHMEFQITIADSNIMRPEVTYPFGVMHPGNLNEVPLHVVTNTRSSSDQPKWPVQNMLQYTDVSSIDPLVPTMQLDHLGDISQYTAEALCHIEVCLGMKPLSDAMFRQNTPGLRNGLLLITGNKGSGKSSFAKGLCRKVAEPPNLAYISHVDCKPLRGKRPDSILKLFEAVFDEASWRQPSVILLDDLDHVAPSPSGPEAELSGEAVYGSRVAEVIRDILRRDIANGARIAVIATSHSRSTIHPLLVNSRGTHFVQKVVSIIPPDKDGREKILRTIIHNRPRISAETIDNIDWHWLRNKTEGYVASDLDTLLSRALHAHSISNDPNTINSETVVLTHTDIMNALEGFTPASIRNVPLHTAGELGWEDVGGLTDVKSILQETLLWPSKYPLLFSSCSLRLRSGLLLYGAPGTGKTLLAGVLAKECQLNFISIKGPELLSKYIGASEQAVRDNFLRAQSAKPCILFFDEFDSIAPRRGHDNTGVTDRVVNQLLTQLDGVEGLDGVYVLAATSRPDLIDPALLRPGRLDKCLECKIPSKEERLKIFESLTRKMSIASSVDFTYFAGKCEYFTGADIKALLYNAQLEAIHEVTGKLLKEDNSMLKKNAQGGKRKHSKQISPRKSQTCMTLKKNVTVDRNMINQKVLYIPKLEEGISVISEEMEENLNSQVEHIQTRLKVNKLTEHTSTSENMFSPVATAKSHLVQVNQSHLLKALEKTRPSVNQQERNRYKKIYENFISSRGGNFGETPVENAKRQTLA